MYILCEVNCFSIVILYINLLFRILCNTNEVLVFRARNRRENSNAKSDSDSDASNKENKKERGREKKKRSASTSSGSGSSSRRYACLAFMTLFNSVRVPAHLSEYGDNGT